MNGKYFAIVKNSFPRSISRLLQASLLLLCAVVAGQAATLWQNTDTTTITDENSISCNLAGLHANTSYWRVFRPITYGFTGVFSPTGVRIGVEEALAGSGGNQPITVRIYTNTGGSFPVGALTLIGTTSTTVANGAQFFQDINVVTSPQIVGTEIVVEIFTPNGQAVNNSFFIGSNGNGQSAPSYISAPDCSAPIPVTTATAGAPNMHSLIALVGAGVTAGDASISGRVLTAGGQGIRNATVTLNLPNGEARTASTGSFGHYAFDGLPVGQAYVVSISAKRYRFANPTRIVTLDDELAGVDFIADDDR